MATSHFKTPSQAQSLRWIKEANPRNWGPALKEWGLSVVKKLGTRSERVGSERSEEIVDYYCGCPPQSALILTLIVGFEMACKQKIDLINQIIDFK
jgi:hypothetical protein